MIRRRHPESGFTAVELLITLFVAAAFLIAAYQLFNLVVKDGGSTRADSRAANVAYDYLRQYAASSTTIPCTASSPLNDAPLTIDGLTSVTIDVDVTCLPDAIASLSKVTATIMYNNPQQTLKYATYVSSSGNANAGDITNGLVAWWKLNGDTNNSVGSPNGINANATSTSGQGNVADTAYSLNGTNSSINTASTFGLGATNASISMWIYNPTASNHGLFIHVGTSGFGIGMGSTSTDAIGTKLVMIFNGIRWIPTSTNVGTGWHHIVMVIDSGGVPTAYLDGASAGTYPGSNSSTPSGSITTIGTVSGSSANYFTGSVDDVRLYNRALTQADILSLYSAGAE
ncbi:MAG TPA: LamG domain-containing protein [Candidatus Microsaccharimonas sp.]|jgi:Tfp pilus assembly protein PilE